MSTTLKVVLFSIGLILSLYFFIKEKTYKEKKLSIKVLLSWLAALFFLYLTLRNVYKLDLLD